MRGRLLNYLFNVAVEIFCQSKIEFRGRVQYTYTSDALQTVKFLVKSQNKNNISFRLHGLRNFSTTISSRYQKAE